MAKRKKLKSSARKTSSLPTRVYSYGVFGRGISLEHKQVIHDQVFRGHLYRRGRIDIETNRRDGYREIRQELSPNLAELTAKYLAADTACKEARQSEFSGINKRDERRAEASQHVLQLRAEAKVLLEQLKKAQKQADLLIKPYARSFGATKRRQYLEAVATSPKDQWLLGDRPEAMAESDFEQAQNQAIKKLGPRIKERIKDELRENDSSSGITKRLITMDGETDSSISKVRAQSGCYVGTYIAMDKALELTFKSAIYNPRHKAFTQEGKVGAQITNDVNGAPITIRQVMAGSNTKLQIRLVPEKFLRGCVGNARRVAAGKKNYYIPQAAIARIQLSGKGARSEHVYVEVPFNLARPFPEDAVVKWVYIVAKRVGTRVEYRLQFTLESSTFEAPPRGNSAIAVNLGWRTSVDGDILVATTWDGSRVDQVKVIPKMRVQAEQANKLQSAADHLFNEARDTFRTWLGEHPDVHGHLESLTEEKYNPETDRPEMMNLVKILKLSSIHQWRAHTKLRTLAWRFRKIYLTEELAKNLWAKWKAARGQVPPPGMSWSTWRATRSGQDLFDTWPAISQWLSTQGINQPSQQMAVYLDWWRVKDTHLVDWSKAMVLRLTRWRQDNYRKYAAQWQREYDYVLFQKWDKAKTAEVPNPEDDVRTEQEVQANSIRQLVGASKLQEAAKQAFGKDRYIEVPMTRISVEHFGCGGSSTPTKTTRMVYCTLCKRLYDQDANAAMHLFGERPGADQTPGTARITEESESSSMVAAE